MTALPAWATDPEMLLITEEGYEALPEEVQKQIEVIEGRVIFCRSGAGEHNLVARLLADALHRARTEDPCTRVLTGSKVHAEDVLLVVEVISPGSEYMDTVDKLAEYAAEGIPLYLVVHLDDELQVEIIQEYRLDWASGAYRCAQTHQEVLVLREPFPVKVAFADLES